MRSLDEPKKTKPILKIFLLTALFLVLTIFLIKFLKLGKSVVGGPKSVVQLITNTGLKTDNDRTNILLLGIGGAGHDGPNLSDTMILASIDKDGKDVALVSIPRDLWSESLSAKVNTAYAFGQDRDEGGIVLAQETIEGIFQMPVHYVIRLDFRGFEKAVDLVSGIDVDVENSFSDPKYPIAGKEEDECGLKVEEKEEDGIKNTYVLDATGSAKLVTEQDDPFTCRYEAISFKKGSVHMDGKTSLKYVRSRHGTNGEGSDFARSARQQKVLTAFKQQVTSTDTLTNPKIVIELAQAFGASIDTNITDEDVPYFVKLLSKIESSAIRRIVLDAGREESVLAFGLTQNYHGQSVLIPKSGNWQDLAKYIQGEIFKINEKTSSVNQPN